MVEDTKPPPEMDEGRMRHRSGPYGSDPQPRIVDPCPSCGHKSLFIGSAGYLTCGNLTSCKEPCVSAAIEKVRAAAQEPQRLDAIHASAIRDAVAAYNDALNAACKAGLQVKARWTKDVLGAYQLEAFVERPVRVNADG